jgi:enoyl-[acyl-carrier protein] reductase/trans-2-enoyl-CoA reductase (NAD+)
MQKRQGRALVSVNKALVTQSSSAIPFIPLYFVILMKVMKHKGLEEYCIHQMVRLFSERLYNGRPLSTIVVDERGRVRIDDREMRPDVQEEVRHLWEQVDSGNLPKVADIQGYNEDFLKLFGFGFQGVDYNADVNPEVPL